MSSDVREIKRKRDSMYNPTFNICVGAVARSRAFFGQGTGRIQLDDVMCIGNESSLQTCQSTTLHNCVHSEDAGVECIGKFNIFL